MARYNGSFFFFLYSADLVIRLLGFPIKKKTNPDIAALILDCGHIKALLNP